NRSRGRRFAGGRRPGRLKIAAMANLGPGDPMPDSTLAGPDGPTQLRDKIGKPLVVYFYPKDETYGCTKEACSFRDLKPRLDVLGVVLLGVSKDSMKSHDKFIRDFGLPFVLLSDPDGQMMAAYGAYGEKTMYGKKTVGVIRSTVIVGPDGKVVKHWPKVAKAEAHPAEVVDFILREGL
ncbi:MAG TPA: peroxiredoxin, partial [Geobacteraceae bacterium]|nr:peroxiredoxin [Geobacteraceae bacterium]